MTNNLQSSVLLLKFLPQVKDIGGEEKQEDSKETSDSYACPFCNKCFSRSSNLRRHVKNVHGPQYVDFQNSQGSIKCVFFHHCGTAFDRSVMYRKHLQEVHNIDLGKKVLCFETEADFAAWKLQEQNRTRTKFSMEYKSPLMLKNSDMKKLTYRCSSLYQKTKSPDCKRMCKKKREFFCPARIDAIITEQRVIISYFSTHIGHELDKAKPADTLEKIMKRKLLYAQQKERLQYAATKDEAKALCSELMQNLDADRYSQYTIKSISEKLKKILNSDNRPSQNSSECEKTAIIVPSNYGHQNLGVSVLDHNVSSASTPTSEKRVMPQFNVDCVMEYTEDDENEGEADTNTEENTSIDGNVFSFYSKSDIADPSLETGKIKDFFPCIRGEVKIISPFSQPVDDFDKRIRKNGFLHNPVALNISIVQGLSQPEPTIPKRLPSETRHFYDELWNRYRNSLNVPHSDHCYIQS